MLPLLLIAAMTVEREGTFQWTKDSAFFVWTNGTTMHAFLAHGSYPIGRSGDEAKQWLAEHPLAPPCGKGPCPSPDKKRSAELSDTRSCDEFNGCVEQKEITLLPAKGPRIQVMAHPYTAKDWAELMHRVADSIEASGFTPTGFEAAKKDRDQSVVYFAAPHAEAAKKIAALVPGGASLAALDWKTKFDVVVALGKSAGKP